MSKTADKEPRQLRVHRVYIEDEKGYCFAVPEETTTEWLESTETVTLKEYR
jgi:KaiC/GvpD/RAD55 family RecA-like ATPase